MGNLTDKTRVYTNITTIALIAQMGLPLFGIGDTTSQIATTILFAIASVFTLKKQRQSIEIDSKAITLTWILIGVIVVGMVNDLLNINFVHLDTAHQEKLRSTMAGLMLMLNQVSKSLFQTDAGKAIQQAKADIKESGVAIIDTDVISKKK